MKHPTKITAPLLFSCLLASLTACAQPSPAPNPTPNPTPTPNPSPAPEQKSERMAGAPAPFEIDGTIVEQGPIGDGACSQRSYQLQPTGGGERIWIHFERCHDSSGPSPGDKGLDSLDLGKRYRVLVRRRASANFGEAPILMDAVLVES